MPSSDRAFVVAFGIAVIADASFPGSPLPPARARSARCAASARKWWRGSQNPILWERVLDLLLSGPARILIVDLDTLLLETRQRVQGLEAFVLAGTDVGVRGTSGPHPAPG